MSQGSTIIPILIVEHREIEKQEFPRVHTIGQDMNCSQIKSTNLSLIALLLFCLFILLVFPGKTLRPIICFCVFLFFFFSYLPYFPFNSNIFDFNERSKIISWICKPSLHKC